MILGLVAVTLFQILGAVILFGGMASHLFMWGGGWQLFDFLVVILVSWISVIIPIISWRDAKKENTPISYKVNLVLAAVMIVLIIKYCYMVLSS